MWNCPPTDRQAVGTVIGNSPLTIVYFKIQHKSTFTTRTTLLFRAQIQPKHRSIVWIIILLWQEQSPQKTSAKKR